MNRYQNITMVNIGLIHSFLNNLFRKNYDLQVGILACGGGQNILMVTSCLS